MSPEEQRIAIAESVGWKHQKGEEPVYGGSFQAAGWFSPKGKFHKSDWTFKSVFGLPDFVGDLNAMHSVEATLTADRARDYHNQLGRMAAGGAWIWFATAAQRAEAYLRTIGKWRN